MDLSTFQRSRGRLWMWILLPLLLMAAAYGPATWYRRHQQRALDERERALDRLPAAERRNRSIQQLIQSVTPPVSQVAEATQEATRRIDAAASQSGLSVRAVKVLEGGGGGQREIALQVQVSGSMRAVVQWIDEVQKPGLLIDVRSALVNAAGPTVDGQVNAEFTLVLRMRSS